MKPKKNAIVLGLDIGSYSVKCVSIRQIEGSVVEVHRAAIAPIGPQGDLAKIFATLDLAKVEHLRVAVSGPSVIIRRISMPLLSAKELQSAIRFEAESHIPFSIDDCIFDYQVLKQDEDKKEMSIMLVAAKRDLVEARHKLLSQLGVQPEVMDLDIFCLINAFEVLNPDVEEKNYGLLNIGHNASSFAIISEGLPAFVREIPFGGVQITRALAESKSLSETQADEVKIKKDVLDAAALKLATEKGLESLADEIRHSIDYVENQIKEELKKVYVSGGGALAVNTAEVLTEETGRPVAFWDGTKNMRVSGDADEKFLKLHSAELNVAFGMTLRGLGAVKK